MEWLWVSGLMVAMYFLGSLVTWYILRMDHVAAVAEAEQRVRASTQLECRLTPDDWRDAVEQSRQQALDAARDAVNEEANMDDYVAVHKALAAIDALDDTP